MSSNAHGTQPAIRLCGVGKTYRIYQQPTDRLWEILRPSRPRGRDACVLSDINLEIARGETVGIVGRNGSGKSTLLRILCGILTPSVGTVETHGRIAPLLALGAGFNNEFTGRENVRLNAAVLGIDRHDIEQRFARIEAFAEIGAAIDQPVRTYSSGMFARLAFAVAVSVEPEILVVDEILSVGDELFSRKCSARIHELRSAGTTILFVSHSATAVLELCNRAILLERGRMIAAGEPREVMRRYHSLLYTGSAEPKPVAPPPPAAPSGSARPAPLRAVGDDDGSFDAALVSPTASEYPPDGARITDIVVRGSSGSALNHLKVGRPYDLTYDVEFDRPADHILFGCNVRNEEGVTVAGLGVRLSDAKSGERLRVRFPLEMRLLPGTYFVTAGVRSELDENFLHRLVETVAFVVDPDDHLFRFGYLSLERAEPTLESLGKTDVAAAEQGRSVSSG
ncbi:MAG: ABC transporter ATP-binding protein [Phycisphaerae bacterium]|nr:ABC transporter ATP-binding protein [Phycisphaerae bacterium]